MLNMGGVWFLRRVQRFALVVLVMSIAFWFGKGRTNGWAAETRSPCAIHHPSDQRVAWHCRRLQRGESLERLFGPRWINVARFNRIDRRHAQPGREIKVPLRLDDVAEFTPLPRAYPDGVEDEKLILIDLSEQFLGAYEQGQLRFSFPIASGEPENATPVGEFRITAADRTHRSCLYTIEHTDAPYPMHYALRFHVNKEGVSYWIHGRDLPGFPASHGCIGLYDEQMQSDHYGMPTLPVLEDANLLYDWAMEGVIETGALQLLANGARVVIRGATPKPDP